MCNRFAAALAILCALATWQVTRQKQREKLTAHVEVPHLPFLFCALIFCSVLYTVVASVQWDTADQTGKHMSFSQHLRFGSPPLSGISETVDGHLPISHTFTWKITHHLYPFVFNYSRKLAMLAGVPLALARNMPGAGPADLLILSMFTPPRRLVTLRSWVQPPLRPSSQKQWYLPCFLHYKAVKPR